MGAELEVKVLNIDLKEMERKIISMGGKLIAREFQINTLIDSIDTPIKEKLNGYLRIRETQDLLKDNNDVTFTLKKIVNNKGLRENLELNTKVADKDIMLEILKDLGYGILEVGTKNRVSYELNGARFDFDEWDKYTYPFPYMEIEIEDLKHLNSIIKLLEIPQENISTKSIMELRQEIKLV